MAIVLMFIGWTGAAFNKDITAEVKVGEPFKIGNYELKVKEINDGDNENYTWQSAAIDVWKNGEFLGTFEPEREFYKSSRQPVGRVAIRRRMNEDLYLNFAQMQDDKVVIRLTCFRWSAGSGPAASC